MFLLCIIIGLLVKGSSAEDEFIYESVPRGLNDPKVIKVPLNETELFVNLTTCEEFLINATFDPFKIIDVDWKIWYFWSDQYEESYTLKFSIPSKVLVDRFRVELDKEMKPPVEWDDAILFMETSIDFSALFVKTDTDGLFRIVPSLAFEYAQITTAEFAMKVIEPPGYLAIMNCRDHWCYALAPVDKMPDFQTVHQYNQEAKKIGFHNWNGRSIVDVPVINPIPRSNFEAHQEIHDDDDEDMQWDQFNQYNADMEAKLL